MANNHLLSIRIALSMANSHLLSIRIALRTAIMAPTFTEKWAAWSRFFSQVFTGIPRRRASSEVRSLNDRDDEEDDDDDDDVTSRRKRM